MAAFPELAILRTELSGDALAHLERLAVSWRLLADLSFSDLLLFAPVAHEDGHRFVILAQVRPTTGQTLYVHDLVGDVVDEVERPSLARAWRHAEIHDGEANVVRGRERVRVETVPVRFRGREIAVLTREAPTTSGRRPGELERYYLEVYDLLAGMVAEGTFPFAREEIEIEGAPRAGDGVIVLDAEGGMRYASPNAVSSLHRLGIHAYTSGVRLGEIGFDEAAVDNAVRGRLPVIEEVEREDASVLVRVIPLMDKWRPAGALVLLRDVTDLRRRDRMLMSKDATIREIHHRVKNNLQTIASLLRLQGRRVDSKEARTAIQESERRIRSIAIVHETLSREAREFVDFGQIVKPLTRVVEESVSTGEGGLRFEVVGDAGELPGRAGDAARGRAQRADAERGRPRLPERRRRADLRARCRCGCSGPTARSTSTWWTTASGSQPASTWTPARGWGCRSSRRWSPASSAGRSTSDRATTACGTKFHVRIPLADRGAPPGGRSRA